MKEKNESLEWHKYYDNFARQLQHINIDLDALASQMLCDVKAVREEVIEPTNKYEYILIGR